jgi:hypothetical protein
MEPDLAQGLLRSLSQEDRMSEPVSTIQKYMSTSPYTIGPELTTVDALQALADLLQGLL